MSIRINVSISENNLILIDGYCKTERYDRSELLALGALEFITNHPPQFGSLPIKEATENITMQDLKKAKEALDVKPEPRIPTLTRKELKVEIPTNKLYKKRGELDPNNYT